MCTPRHSRYVVVSACRNESAYIDGLLKTVAEQTLRPLRWIIVDDGSTDDTYARAATRAGDLNFLQVVKMPTDRPRSFASQAYAANYGYELLRGLEFDFVGFLDADIRLGIDYYEELVGFFHDEPSLGLAGGALLDKYPDRIENSRYGSEGYHVAGGVQFFRRLAFDQIGGYLPIEGGGQDTVADFMSMMYGWNVRTVPALTAMHLRPQGFTKEDVLRRGLNWGKKFYSIGYHPVFYFGQCLRRISWRPIVIGSLCQLIGFLIANLRAQPRPVPPHFVHFLRREQMRRLRTRLGFPMAQAFRSPRSHKDSL